MKPTAALSRKLTRLQLTTKQVNGGFYRGSGTGSMGRHTKHGGYVIEWPKVRTYVVPAELAECKLSPFVTNLITLREARKNPEAYYKNRMAGRDYLRLWKRENGTD